MFEKLLAGLPHNPSLVRQLSFYGKRMRGEQSVRRVGLLFIVLAFLVQFFAVFSPPQSTVAASNNDLVNGGINSAAYAAGVCRSNTANYGTILASYGISCDAVAAAPTVSINSTDYNHSLYSMGRLPYGLKGETPVNIGGTTYYMRYLWAWDTQAYSTYTALRVTGENGQSFFLLYNCGNIVSIGLQPTIPPCQYNNTILANSPQCFPPCPIPGKSNLPQSSPQCVKPCPYNTMLPANSPKCFKPCQYNSAIPSASAQCFPPCQYNKSIPKTNSQCKPCEQSLSSSDKLACVQVHKTAANLTQGIGDANNTTAQPSDKIEYTLYAQNTGKADIKAYVFTEDLSDVLDYANVDNLNGGKIDQNGQVTWPAVEIKPGQTATKKITVVVKSVIPQTPTSSSDPGHFNLVMTNVYGNTININVPGSPAKVVETATTTLPNTGPGTSLFIGGVIVIFAGYFFSRSRLLADETTIAVHDNISGGL